LNDRLSSGIARWLSHPTGVAQAFITTLIWFSIPFLVGFSETTAIFWYLAYCTFISYATQFTLAYQNKKAELHMLNLLKLLVAMAEEDKIDRFRQGVLLGEIQADLEEEEVN